MASALRNMRIDRIALTPRGADQDADIVLAKSDTVNDDEVVEGADMPDLNEDIAKALGEEAVAALDAKTVDALNASIPAPVEPSPALSVDDIERGSVEIDGVKYAVSKSEPEPEEIKKTDEVVALEKRASDAEVRIEKMEDERSVRVRTDKALTDYSAVPGATSAELGQVLHAMEKAGVPETHIALIDTVLTSASKAIKEGHLFKEIGSSTDDTGSKGELAKMAKAAEAEGKTAQRAMADVLSTPEGAAAYEAMETPATQGAV